MVKHNCISPHGITLAKLESLLQFYVVLVETLFNHLLDPLDLHMQTASLGLGSISC